MTDWIQVTLRLLHIFFGVFWAGTVFFLARFFLPAIQASGSAGDTVTYELLIKRKLAVAVPVAALVTVLAGVALYWRNVSLSGGTWMHSRPGSVFALGGFTAIVALGVGATMIGPSFEHIIKIRDEAKTAGAPLSEGQVTKIANYQKRIAVATRIASLGLFISVITMSIGRYL